MPPKSKAAGAASAASGSGSGSVVSPSSSSAPPSSERALLNELHALQTQHLQQRTRGPATWATAVALLTSQCKEIEGVTTRLQRLQHQQQRDDKAARAAALASATTPAAYAPASASAAAAPAIGADGSVSSGVVGLSLSPSQPQLTALAEWLQREAPASLYGVAWEFDANVSDAEGTGVRAVKPLAKGDQFMSIPRRVMMTSDGLCAASPVGQYLLASNDFLCQQNPSLLLAVCLLYERARGDASFYAPYIRCLPRRFNLPLLWSVDQVRSFLQVSPAVFDVLSLQRAHAKNYVHLYEALSKGGFLHKQVAGAKGAPKRTFRFSWANFSWAVCVLMSRQNNIPPPTRNAKQQKVLAQKQREAAAAAAAAGAPPPPQGEQPSVALIPGWDSCNHRGTGEIATFFAIDTQTSDSHTTTDVAAGEPIYLYYGSRRNAHLLTYAGFVDAQHRNDEMIFELSIDGKPWATAVPLTGNGPAEAAAALTASPASPTPVDPLLKIKLMLLAKVGMGSGFMVKLPLLDRPDGFEGATGNRFTAAKEAKEAAEAAASASGSGDAQDPEAAARALSAAQEAKQAARASFRALLHFLRVACLATKEAAALALKHKPDGFGNPLLPSFHFLPSLYPDHDLDAFTFLHDSLTAALQSYPTTLEHDESELLRDEARKAAEEHELPGADGEDHPHTLRARHRLGIELRRSEKKLLTKAIAKAREWKEAEHPKIEQQLKQKAGDQ